ncbi:hypothetical protein [Raoultibacter timonensis]|uniref:Uncharacterized protein n=1 Tax=Raoultibacter timonensis TaxID=1907662 RepID=A0ABM7WKP3_9ACTN|nr:hypothetical protein [Raoultibacter timonensis]BDE96884.1 hypothetical protein CE91St30_22170 [Raoultibacter timonensis]BDF51487.1 hypothetical protein CE91St31_22170 [Raoultibacter timonensis]
MVSMALHIDDAKQNRKNVVFSWRFVEQSFHNDNRLSWWLSHLSSPLD